MLHCESSAGSRKLLRAAEAGSCGGCVYSFRQLAMIGQHGSGPALVRPMHCQSAEGVAGPASDWGLAEKQAPMRMRLTAPMRTPAKTKTKRMRHAHAELAAAEPVLRKSPEAPPIMVAAANLNSANQTRMRVSKHDHLEENSIGCRSKRVAMKRDLRM